MIKPKGTLITYEAPKGELLNCDYTVKVRLSNEEDWKVLFSHDAIVSDWHIDQSINLEHMSFAYFDSDFSQPVEVSVISNNVKIESARIRPHALNIEFTIHENEIRFFLDQPKKISVEINGDIFHNLFIFADYIEELPNLDENPDIIYFGPGIHDIGCMVLKSNQMVYIHGSAIVFGCFYCDGADNLIIKGRGILDGSKLEHRQEANRARMINLLNGHNIIIEGIIIRDSPCWSIVPEFCTDVIIRNIKQITYNWNSDGLDICSCTKILIEDVFIRNYDDNISIKSYGGDNRDILMKDSVIWSDRAHNMLIGPESSQNMNNVFEKIIFRNIDVLENREFNDVFMGVMALMCADNAFFQDITWENIRVDDISYGKLISIQFAKEFATTVGSKISNIRFNNINYTGRSIYKSKIHGFDDVHDIDGVEIRNLKINGYMQEISSKLFDINQFVRNISFSND